MYNFVRKCTIAASAAILALAAFSCGNPDGKEAVKPPLMGWSSWNSYMVNISDSIIRHEVDNMVRLGLRDAGYRQVNIDDGLFGGRNQEGKMTGNPYRFPDGLRGVADYIHANGMKAGIYSDAGDNTCASGGGDTLGFGAGLYGHDIEDADLYFNQWDFDFIKIDYCGGSHLGLTEEARYKEIKRNIDSVANKPVDINICRWAYPGTWAPEVGDSWRISGDIYPQWESLVRNVQQTLYLSAYAGGGHYNDIDMMIIGYGNNPSPLPHPGALKLSEEQAHMALWCILSSPLVIGCRLDSIPSWSLEVLKNKELIDINQDPLGLQAYVAQHEGDGYVLVKDIKRRQGPERAVAIYNPSDNDVQFTVTPEEIGFAGKFTARDLVKHEDNGTFDVLRVNIPPHNVKMLKVKGKRCEQKVYEAEWSFMPRFSRISAGPVYRSCEDASGRMVADGIGGSEDNYLQWKDVYSRKGGRYTIAIRLVNDLDVPELSGKVPFKVCVNGTETEVTADMSTNGEATLETELQRGFNDIRIVSSGRMPAVDCMTLSKD